MARNVAPSAEVDDAPAVTTTASPASGNPPGTPPTSEETLSEARPFIRWASAGIALLFIGVAVLAWVFVWRGSASTEKQSWPIAFAFSIMGFALGTLHLIDRKGKGYGLFGPLIGADRRFSTSLTQVGLWTLAVGTGLAWLVGIAMATSEQLTDEQIAHIFPAGTWDDYLILLGGPFAAAVLAKGIVTYKQQEGTLQKVEPTTTTPAQVIQADDGTVDLVDAQYLVFNFIALGYFVVELVRSSALPIMPAPLLAMTGATAALYVGKKAAERNKPTITSVTPITVKKGKDVTVFGTNFDPSEESDPHRRITVALTGLSDPIFSNRTTDTRVTFTVPTAAAAGAQVLRVTSTAGVETEPHEIVIEDEASQANAEPPTPPIAQPPPIPTTGEAPHR